MHSYSVHLKHSLIALLLGASLTACGSAVQSANGRATALPSATAQATIQPSIIASPTIQVATALPTTSGATPASAAAVPVAINESQAIAQAVLVHLSATLPNTPVVVGTTAIEGDYATAMVQPYGSQSITAFVRRTAAGWEIIQASASLDRALLQQQGVPATLPAPSAANEIVAAWSSQLQDPRGAGVTGALVLEGIVGDYARGFFRPADPTTQDGYTAFFARQDGIWQQVSGGTAFDAIGLQQLGIPETLWTGQ